MKMMYYTFLIGGVRLIMKFLFSVYLLLVGSTVLVFADEHERIGAFDPVATFEYIQETVERTNCTPICGSPTCCIAIELRFPKYVGEGDMNALEMRMGQTGYDIAGFLQAAEIDETLYSDVELTPIVDLDEFADAETTLMQEVQSIGVDMDCSPCCYNCGGKVCCGGCWTF